MLHESVVESLESILKHDCKYPGALGYQKKNITFIKTRGFYFWQSQKKSLDCLNTIQMYSRVVHVMKESSILG